jgi:hypothetical protein
MTDRDVIGTSFVLQGAQLQLVLRDILWNINKHKIIRIRLTVMVHSIPAIAGQSCSVKKAVMKSQARPLPHAPYAPGEYPRA